MHFCGFKPPARWCSVIGNKSNAPPRHKVPGPQERATRCGEEAQPAHGASAPSPPAAKALPTLTPHHGLAGNGRQGSPRPGSAWGWGPFPSCLLPEQAGGGGVLGAQPLGASGGKGKCPFAHSSLFPSPALGQRAAAPPRPVSTSRYGNAQPVPPSPHSGGCPSPAPNPKLPLQAPGRSPWRREKVVWQRLLWARLRVPPSSPIYF